MTNSFKNRVIKEEVVTTRKYRYELAEIFGEGFEIHRIALKDFESDAFGNWEVVCKA